MTKLWLFSLKSDLYVDESFRLTQELVRLADRESPKIFSFFFWLV